MVETLHQGPAPTQRTPHRGGTAQPRGEGHIPFIPHYILEQELGLDQYLNLDLDIYLDTVCNIVTCI